MVGKWEWERTAEGGRRPAGGWLLAVSGGRDSMVLLDWAAQTRAADVAGVACFDHATGPVAAQAVELVRQEAARRGLRFFTARAGAEATHSEAGWRAARYTFLRSVARGLGAGVVTAHTRDDQIETVLLRLLRGAGARGLAGMAAATRGVSRPLLQVARAEVAHYAVEQGLVWVEDPSNARLDFARNRIRLEILPALERVRPGFGEWLHAVGTRAAALRISVEQLLDPWAETAPDAVVVQSEPLAGIGPEGWSLLWPAIAARADVVMERRGIARAAAWAPGSRTGQRIQLSGGASIERTRGTFVLRRNSGA